MKTIPLTQGKVALVDDADYEWLMQWTWYAWFSGHRWYARRSNGHAGAKSYMHRVILNAQVGSKVDHRDHNGLNNQRWNLRAGNQSLNMANQLLSSRNTSGFKGVYWDASRNKWVAQLAPKSGHVFIGRFLTAAEAASAYDLAALERWGQFAQTNEMLGLL